MNKNILFIINFEKRIFFTYESIQKLLILNHEKCFSMIYSKVTDIHYKNITYSFLIIRSCELNRKLQNSKIAVVLSLQFQYFKC